MMNMPYLTYLLYFAYYAYVTSQSIFHIFHIFCIFMAVSGVRTAVWCRFLLTCLAFSNTFERTRNYLRGSALRTCGTCSWSCHFVWMVFWTPRSLRNTTGNTLCDQYTILLLSWLESPFCSFSGTCCIAGDILQRIRRMSRN